MVKELEAFYDNGEYLAGKSTMIILGKGKDYSLKYLLALLNSRFYTAIFIARNKYSSMSGGYLNVK